MSEENHKGSWCNINPSVFCQEGSCSECEIYIKWDNILEEIDGKLP